MPIHFENPNNIKNEAPKTKELMINEEQMRLIAERDSQIESLRGKKLEIKTHDGSRWNGSIHSYDIISITIKRECNGEKMRFPIDDIEINVLDEDEGEG